MRSLGFDGEITVIGDEPHRPHTRPPLSKEVLTGTEPEHSVFLPAPDDVHLHTGVTAVGLDRDRSAVELADGESMYYDGLVIATGARARRLGTGETMLRGLDDAVRLRGQLARALDVAVAGGFLDMKIAPAAGDVPNTEWLHGSGIRLDGGVVTDNACRVAPNIVAARDVVSVHGRDGRHRGIGELPHLGTETHQTRSATPGSAKDTVMQSIANAPRSDMDIFSDDVMAAPYPAFRELRDVGLWST